MSTLAPLQRKSGTLNCLVVARKAVQRSAHRKSIGVAPIRGASPDSAQAESLPIQRKLEVSEPDDALEQEAERVAESVMRMALDESVPQRPEETNVTAHSSAGVVRRACSSCMGARDDEESRIQRSTDKALGMRNGVGNPDWSQRLRARSGGEPLPDSVRQFMEPRFGASFGHVNVHHDETASLLAREIGARAFTLGRDVFFKQGEFAPRTERGRRLIAHELAHVLQTRDRSIFNTRRLLRQSDSESVEPGSQGAAEHIPGPCADVPWPHTVIRRGTVSPAVRDAQRKLNRFHALDQSAGGTGLPGAPLIPDCIFGPLTEAATLEFQARAFPGQRQEQDGIIGPKTWRKLDDPATAVRAPAEPCIRFQPGTDNQVKSAFLQVGYVRPSENVSSLEGGLEEPTGAARAVANFAPAEEDIVCRIDGGGLVLPEPSKPTKPVGPVRSSEEPFYFCLRYLTKIGALKEWLIAKAEMLVFIRQAFGDKEVEDLYMTYLNTPKSGTKGTLPARRLFSNPSSKIIQHFKQDPETLKQQDRILELIHERVGPAGLVPPVGQVTPPRPLRPLLVDADLLDLPMSFKEPTKRIPGLIAGGPGKNASDAGDDVRNVDGHYTVFNLGFGTIEIAANLIFDIFDAVDFCPGAPGDLAAQLLVTWRLSRLEATPDIPTYDTPFEVIYSNLVRRRF